MTPAGDVSYLGLATAGLFVAAALALSVAQRLGVERGIAVAALRALVQLLAVGFALELVIDPDSPLILSWAWIVGMVLFASTVVARRAPEVPRLTSLAIAAFGATALMTLGVLFGLGVFPLEARALVPLGGMMVGNSMNAIIVVSRRIVDELSEKRDEVEARLALGQDSRQAGLPYVRNALRTALSPQIETTKAVGIVFLPGAMTGLILAGVEPLEAVRVQIVVMYLILGSAATTTAVVALGLIRRLFTADHRLADLPQSD